MKGKIRNLVLVFVVMLGLLAAFTQTESAHAWPWSTHTKVEVWVAKPGSLVFGGMRCLSGTLVAGNRTYYGSVSSPLYSTKCKVSFDGVPVDSTAYITVQAKYLFSPSKTVSAWRWVPKPATFESVTVADILLN